MNANGANFNYKFGSKNNWRRTVWNRIVERLAVPVRDAVALYFAGPQDRDREIAIQKGFRPHNLIAIDRDCEVTKRIRAAGNLCIDADAVQIVKNWTGLKVDAIHADYCSGLTGGPIELIDALTYNGLFCRAVVSVNLMRGRESHKPESFNGGLYDLYGRGNHRGEALFNISTTLFEWDCEDMKCEEWKAEMLPNLREYLNTRRPAFSEYKSTSGQVFDSGVWEPVSFAALAVYVSRKNFTKQIEILGRSLEWALAKAPAATRSTLTELENLAAAHFHDNKAQDSRSSAFRKILATRATRTRKLAEYSAGLN